MKFFSAIPQKYIAWILFLLFLITSPYLFAYFNESSHYVFGGFLLNPIDGNSYLAKMHQGEIGANSFTLPYSAEPGEGTYLFLFYLFLGWISGILGIPLAFMFHLARILCSLILYLVLYCFLQKIPEMDETRRWYAFIVTTAGSGLGWLFVLFGVKTSDLWVAEAYPFLSCYTNPHFPLGLSLVLLIMMDFTYEFSAWRKVKGILLGFTLAMVMPFGYVIAIIVGVGYSLWVFIQKRTILWDGFFWAGLGGVPWMLYFLWITNSHTSLAIWNQQNQTPSPFLGDLIISLSPLLFFMLIDLFKRKGVGSDFKKVLLLWAGLGLVLIYVPLGLQRRFMTGIYIPVSILGLLGCVNLFSTFNRSKNIVRGVVLVSLITNVFILLLGSFGIFSKSESIYIERNEFDALQWMARVAKNREIILASPGLSLYIPVFTEARVVYGHPFETVNAKEEENGVIDFYSGKNPNEKMDTYLHNKKIGYVIFGPRERKLGDIQTYMVKFKEVYWNGNISIYEVD